MFTALKIKEKDGTEWNFKGERGYRYEDNKYAINVFKGSKLIAWILKSQIVSLNLEKVENNK